MEDLMEHTPRLSRPPTRRLLLLDVCTSQELLNYNGRPLMSETDSCALVNYTGSLGFGETHIRKLLGQCGTLDVQDCIASVEHLIKEGVSERGHRKQFVWGGSHGGFLAAHCEHFVESFYYFPR